MLGRQEILPSWGEWVLMFAKRRLIRMKIYTKTGDKGETALFTGRRVPKDNLRVEAYGTVDELNAVLGMAVTALPAASPVREPLLRIQRDLFDLGGDLATPPDKAGRGATVVEAQVAFLEATIDGWERELPPLKRFILPGGTAAAATLQLARAVCRRAERRVITLARAEEVSPVAIQYLNRLSDLLFVAARYVNHLANVKEPEVIFE